MRCGAARRSSGPTRSVVSTLSYCVLLLLSWAASPQQKPREGPPAPRRQTQKQPLSPKAEAEKDPIEEHYRAAETFQLAGDFQTAETEYRHVISLSLQRMASIRVLAQDDPQALIYLQSATAVDSSDVEAQLSVAELYLRAGDLGHAKVILQSVLAKDEHQAPARKLLGSSLYMEGDYAGAAEQLKAALVHQSDLDAAYSLGLTYLRLNRVADATNVFDEMLVVLGSSPELYVLIGRGYQEGVQFDLAIEQFRKALALNPTVPRAHSYLGTVCLLKGGATASKEAQTEFEAELAHNPSDYSSHFHLGVLHFLQHELKQAEAELNKAVELQPTNPEGYFYLAQVEVEAGEDDAALVRFNKAISLYGSDSKASQPVHEAYSKALEKSGNHQLAQQELETARGLGNSDVKTSPGSSSPALKSPDEMQALLHPPAPKATSPEIPSQYLAGLKEALGNAYHNLGVILAKRSQYGDAAALFAEAARWSPGIEALDKNWGTASFRAGQHKGAIAPLERSLLVDPKDANVRQMLALSYFMSEDFPKAAATFRPILANLPDNPSLLYAAGISLAKAGDSNAASEIFRRMLAQNPDVPEVHLFLGQAHAEQKEDDEALKEFSRALELNPKLPEANYSAGIIHLRQGDRERAENDFRAELAVDPGDPSAEYRLGYILLAEQKQAEAVEILGDVVRQKPNDADAHYVLGKALLEKGDLKPATERLETAVHLDPAQPAAYYQLSLAYRRQGLIKEADTTLRQYEKLKQKKP